MDISNNSQSEPIQTPEPQTQNQQPNPVTNSTTKKRRNGKKIGLLIAVFALLLGGGSVYVIARSKVDPQAQGYTYWYTYRMQEDFRDGKIHTNTQDCYDNFNVCHKNGSLVFLGGNKKAWKSDPSKNSTGKKLSSPTWDGPYWYSPGPYYSSTPDSDYAITGSQRVCFLVKDVTKGGNAKIAIVVRNAKDDFPNSPTNGAAQTIYAIEGTLKSNFKKGYTNVCAQYNNPYTAYKQTYRLYVKSGQVEIDRASHAYQYYWYYTPYNPYQYGSASSLTAAVIQKQTGKTVKPSSQITAAQATCSSLQRTSTELCMTESQAKVSDVSQQLTDLKSTSASDAAD